MIDFCQIVLDIETDPKAIVPLRTVRELRLLQEHVASCQTCNEKVQAILQDAPPSRIAPGLN